MESAPPFRGQHTPSTTESQGMPYGEVKPLSRQELMGFLGYEAGTGKLFWQVSPSRRTRIGSEAGWLSNQGYREIEFRGKTYQSHRLAWLFSHGEWPENEVDHINGVRDDNRLSNLRAATKSQNQHNRKKNANGRTSRLKGVSFHKVTGKWAANIQADNSRKHLGLFESEEAAGAAYAAASIALHGEFSRVA